MLSPELNQTLRRALAHANERGHEYATLEHLLLALTEDNDALAGLPSRCVEPLRRDLIEHPDSPITNLVSGASRDAGPTAGFQRVLQRAAISAHSSGREEVTGADLLAALSSACASQAAILLQRRLTSRGGPARFINHDAVCTLRASGDQI